MPRLWPSPQAMSAPWLPGVLNRPKASGSLKAATQSAPPACARSAKTFRGSIAPKKFGDCTATAAISSTAPRASGSLVPSGRRGSSRTSIPVGSR